MADINGGVGFITKTVTHQVTMGSEKFACCGRTPFTVPMRDGITTDPKAVTCRGSRASQ